MNDRSVLAAMLFLLAGCTAHPAASKATTGTTVTYAPPTTSAQLSWTATASAEGYSVEISTDDASFSVASTVTTNSATISSLTKGTTYYFRIRAYNSSGYSAYSSVVSKAL